LLTSDFVNLSYLYNDHYQVPYTHTRTHALTQPPTPTKTYLKIYYNNSAYMRDK